MPVMPGLCKVILKTCVETHFFKMKSSVPERFRTGSAGLLYEKMYPKMVVAGTGSEEYKYEGIRIVDIADWLSSENSDIFR